MVINIRRTTDETDIFKAQGHYCSSAIRLVSCIELDDGIFRLAVSAVPIMVFIIMILRIQNGKNMKYGLTRIMVL